MNRILILFASLMLLVDLGGCKRATEEPVPAGVDPKGLTYADPELRTLVVQMDDAIRRTQPDWGDAAFLNQERRTSKYSRRVPDHDYYKAEWNSHPSTQYEENEDLFVAPNHRMTIKIWTGNPPDNSERIAYASFRGEFHPETGWGVRCSFGTSGSRPEFFSILLFECPKGSGMYLDLQNPSIRDRIRITDVPGEKIDLSYGYFASLKDRHFDRKTLRELWRSPEDFRRVALESLDQLERKVQSQFAKGGLISNSPWPVPYDPSRGAPDVPPHLDKPMPEAKRNEALKTILKKIATKRRIIEKDYREMHAALVRTLPLGECLEAVLREHHPSYAK